jgi:hypothetical protein
MVLGTAKIKPRPEFDPLPDFINVLKVSYKAFGVLTSGDVKTTYEVFHYFMGYLAGLARAIECTLWAMSWVSIGPCNMELCARTQLELEGYLAKIKDLAKRAIELIELIEGRENKDYKETVGEFNKLYNDIFNLANEIGIRLGPIMANLIIAGSQEPKNASSQGS